MNKILLLLLSLTIVINSFGQANKQQFVSTDIDNFWHAYDKISSTKDSVAQYNYLKELYIGKGSIGLKSLVEVRGYTNKEYIDAINQ